jgi:hypothetical protein
MMPLRAMRAVVLRDERAGADRRLLSARIDDSGALAIAGHDLGPATAPVSDTGEYEWCHTYPAATIPAIRSLLDARAEEDLMGVLERRWTGPRSYELERRLRESGLPRRFWCWP